MNGTAATSGRDWPDEADNANSPVVDRAMPAPHSRERHRAQHGGADSGSGHPIPPGNAETDPARFDLSDYPARLFSGPVSELYGVADAAVGGDEPSAFADDSGRVAHAAGQGSPSRGTAGQPGARQVDDQQHEVQQQGGSGLVRPYFRTRGRTKPTYDLAIEALVSTSERGRLLDGVRVPEHRSICDLCLDTRSVAEVAALLSLPLGVVRVLVGDVAGLGLVLVHSGSSDGGDRPSIEFMERVLSGLRRI